MINSIDVGVLTVLYANIAFTIFLLFYLSKKGTLYVFSPAIFIYVGFVVNDIIPLLTFSNMGIYIPSNIVYVTFWTSIINDIFLVIYMPLFKRKVVLRSLSPKPNVLKNRKKMFILFLVIIMFVGIYTKVTINMFKGTNVEDLRRTSEIGIGFIRQIPMTGIYYIMLLYMMEKYGNHWKYRFLFCGFVAILLFLATAARAQILILISIYLIWYNIKKRGLKWYEYFCIYYLMSPIAAILLALMRSGQKVNLVVTSLYNTMLSLPFMIFSSNTIRLMGLAKDDNLLYGRSYYYGLYTIIPRFLWPDKPLSIDYEYKKIVGYNFEGGGIYTTIPNDFYLNFGSYFYIGYIVWMFIIYFLYKKLLCNKTRLVDKYLLLIICAFEFDPKNILGYLELYILLMLCFLVVNKKWRVV